MTAILSLALSFALGGLPPRAAVAGRSGSPEALQRLFQELRKAQLSRDVGKAAAITRGLLPDETRIRAALRDGAPADAVRKILAFHKGLPSRDEALATLLSADLASTEIRVHGATTKEMADYARGSVAFSEFPGAVQALATTLLRPGTTFFEVELLKPGADRGMKYHLFYWDGQHWSMLGPIWRALR